MLIHILLVLFEAFPVTYCSKQAELDGDDPVCQDHRCSYIDLKCLGAPLVGDPPTCKLGISRV